MVDICHLENEKNCNISITIWPVWRKFFTVVQKLITKLYLKITSCKVQQGVQHTHTRTCTMHMHACAHACMHACTTHTHNHFTTLQILSRTTWVSWYQKKHSPTHTYRGHQSSFICFFHLIRSMYHGILHAYTHSEILHNNVQCQSKQEAQLLLGMADHTGPVVKLSYLRELVWQPSWELDICPDWLNCG